MRKLLALALVALALAGGTAAFVSLETPTPAAACDGAGCN
jgi:hypothetical protein